MPQPPRAGQRRAWVRSRAKARSFHPAGMRRLIGFQAVTKAPWRAAMARSSASTAAQRRPMRAVASPAV
jgi:hypothetical protein